MTSSQIEPNRSVNDAQSVFELWRLDDNANDFLVDTFNDRASADAKLREMSAGGHKQTYWIKQVVPQQES